LNIKLAIDIIIIILLILIIYQDFKFRAFSWILLPALFVAIISTNLLEHELLHVLNSSILNFSFLVIQFCVISIYFSIKQNRVIKIADHYIGWGDILLWVALCPLFSTINFILFYISSSIIVLIGWGLFRIASKNKNHFIPLAGGVSLLMIVCYLNKYFMEVNFYSNLFNPGEIIF